MTNTERPLHEGMRHVALFVHEFEACEIFYLDILGMKVEWRPDADNVYLCSGIDNLALHRAVKVENEELALAQGQRLDHIGFIVATAEKVDQWYAFMQEHKVRFRNEPRTHRDGARSFYCYDPDGTLVQMIYHPPVSGGA